MPILATLALLMSACSDDEVNPIVDGTYVGTFAIVSDLVKTQKGSVTFRFEGNVYSCVPEKMYLPPSGAGRFQTFVNLLALTDTAIHTAEFDWTLILNGTFTYTFDGSKLVLVQNDVQFHRVRTISVIRQNQ